jgi:S1-C subfamily serine protease
MKSFQAKQIERRYMESPQIPEVPPTSEPQQIPVLPPPPPSPQTPPPATSESKRRLSKSKRFSAILLVFLLLVGLVAGGIISYALTYSDFNSRLNILQNQWGISSGNGNTTVLSNSVYLLGENVSLSNLYNQVKPSVVVIQGLAPQYGSTFFGGGTVLIGYNLQQGSGFITTVNDVQVIVTNNHVVADAINVTVTFYNGDSYPANVLGADPKADLAVLSVSPMPNGFQSLMLAHSDLLQVGTPVVAVGSPYGLSGTLTTGVISAVGRTIIEESSTNKNGQTIADIIQTSTAINPGNSGGPLVTYGGDVVGITTAGISNSESLGFAIPSDTLIRELSSLVSSGSYDQHPSINAEGTDMNYQIAQALGITTTYGYLVESVSTSNGLKGGNSQMTILGARTVIGGDIIIGINGQRITNTDDLLSYLEQHTLPGQTVDFTVIRSRLTQTVSVTIGKA